VIYLKFQEFETKGLDMEPKGTFVKRMQERRESNILRGGKTKEDSQRFKEKIEADLKMAGIIQEKK